MINFSIIIPHKNSVDLLKRCLNSIPLREDIEIIVVDDDSNLSDEDYAKLNSFRNTCVKIIINHESKGAGHARNIGLSEATGKWLIFSDADDFFAEDAFEIFNSHVDDKSEIIYFLSDHVYSDTMQLFDNNCMGLNDKVKAYDGTISTEDKLKYGICVPWGRMFSGSLIKENHISFDEVRYGNDTMFAMRTAYKAQKVAVDLRTVYYFTVNRGSLTHRINKESIACRMEVDLRKNKMMREIGKPHCQVSVTPHIYQASKFGLAYAWSLIRLSLSYGFNPFKGTLGWIIDHYKHLEESKARKRYEIK